MNFFEAEITEIRQETSDSYSYIMKVPQGYSWKAGQHALFRIKDYTLPEGEKDGRIFTIASAPEDGFLMFTTRISPQHSAFKELLLKQVKPGDTILAAAPLGNFDFNMEDYEKTLVVAGGIGITPIRSLLRHYEEGCRAEHRITLLYSDDRGEFAYGEFWKEIQEKLPQLELFLISDREELSSRIRDYAAGEQNAAEYMIAGSPGMNASISKNLMDLGILKENIRMDNFMGYPES